MKLNYFFFFFADAAQSDAQQIQSALKSVQAKLGQSLRAPERPLFDLGVGLSYELDTSDASLLVRPMLRKSLLATSALLALLRLLLI